MTELGSVGELDVVGSTDFDAVAGGDTSIVTDVVVCDSVSGALLGGNYVVGGK